MVGEKSHRLTWIEDNMSYSRQLERIVEDYIKEFDVDEVDLDEVSIWAVKTGRYQRKPLTLAQQCRREIARSLRVQHSRDPQGREPRKWHAVIVDRPEQKAIWAEFKIAKPDHMRISLQQRRQKFAGGIKQHKTDAESYNDNNIYGAKITLFDYDFNKDLEEGDLPGEYKDDDDEPLG